MMIWSSFKGKQSRGTLFCKPFSKLHNCFIQPTTLSRSNLLHQSHKESFSRARQISGANYFGTLAENDIEVVQKKQNDLSDLCVQGTTSPTPTQTGTNQLKEDSDGPVENNLSLAEEAIRNHERKIHDKDINEQKEIHVVKIPSIPVISNDEIEDIFDNRVEELKSLTQATIQSETRESRRRQRRQKRNMMSSEDYSD